MPEIDERLARRLVDSQFPRWAGLPIRRVLPDGWDNRTFRLGDELTIRLPSGDWYALQVDKEQRWLPALAHALPLRIPTPVAQGRPGQGYPYPWSIYRWIDGQVATPANITDMARFAVTLARFLVALRRVDATGGPLPGQHNFFRGAPVTVYAEEAMDNIATLRGEIPRDAALRVWHDASSSLWSGPPVWLHGDVAATNLLVRHGTLAAVIDFGCCAIGDPACDVVIAWTLLSGRSRDAFRANLALDDATWARGRGWALWKAMNTLAKELDRGGSGATPRRIIERILTDHATEQT